MSRTDHPALLSTQLVAVLDELEAGHGDLREAACLAGQLERLDASAPTLAAARARVEQAPPELMLGEPFDVQALAGDVLAAEDPDARAHALLALDEVCAGACFLGLTRAVKLAVRAVVVEIRGEPASWSAQVPLARSVLGSCPPVDGDPAGELWAVLAACPPQEDGRWGSVPLDGPSLLDLLPPASSSGTPAAGHHGAPAPVLPSAAARPAPALRAALGPVRRRGGLSVRRSGDDEG